MDTKRKMQAHGRVELNSEVQEEVFKDVCYDVIHRLQDLSSLAPFYYDSDIKRIVRLLKDKL